MIIGTWYFCPHAWSEVGWRWEQILWDLSERLLKFSNLKKQGVLKTKICLASYNKLHFQLPEKAASASLLEELFSLLNALAVCDCTAQILCPLALLSQSHHVQPHQPWAPSPRARAARGQQPSAAANTPESSEQGRASCRLPMLQPNRTHLISQSPLLVHMTC